jgi:uncharacterized protein YecE (DUF72 family)
MIMSLKAFEIPLWLPPQVRVGTSSWTYPGWRGIVYHREYKNERAFTHESLREYASHSLFSTVGVDSSFYQPPSDALLRRYCSMTPDGFKFVSKMWERLTIYEFPNHSRYGKDKGKKNELFLNEKVGSQVLNTFLSPKVLSKVGPIVLQFPYFHHGSIDTGKFLSRLRRFLVTVPSELRIAVELRTPHFLTAEYVDIINESGASHCFNQWHFMLPLHEQMKTIASYGGLKASFFVARILTPQGMSYAKSAELMEPYNALKRDDTEMQHNVSLMIRRAIEKKGDAYLIMNNQCEGNAPLSLQRIMDRHERFN